MALISLTYAGVDTIAVSSLHPKDGAQAPRRSRAASPLLILLEMLCICRRNCCKNRDSEKREEVKNRLTKITHDRYRRTRRTASEKKPGELSGWVLVQRDSLLTALCFFFAVVVV